MKMIVKEIPIRKSNITYNVGSVYPYTVADKKLLWNLTELSAKDSKVSFSNSSLVPSAERVILSDLPASGVGAEVSPNKKGDSKDPVILSGAEVSKKSKRKKKEK